MKKEYYIGIIRYPREICKINEKNTKIRTIIYKQTNIETNEEEYYEAFTNKKVLISDTNEVYEGYQMTLKKCNLIGSLETKIPDGLNNDVSALINYHGMKYNTTIGILELILEDNGSNIYDQVMDIYDTNSKLLEEYKKAEAEFAREFGVNPEDVPYPKTKILRY